MLIQATSFRHCLISGRCSWERVDVEGKGEEASNLPEQNCLNFAVCQNGDVETNRESAGASLFGTSLVLSVQAAYGAQEGSPARFGSSAYEELVLD